MSFQSELEIPVLSNQMVMIQPGRIPNVPDFIRLPPQLQQYVGNTIFTIIATIQNKSTENPLRKVFFNRISYNGYANQMFEDYCVKLTNFIMLNISAFPNIDPAQIIQRCIDVFTKFKVCQMVMNDQNLLRCLDQQHQHACYIGVETFESEAAQISQRANQTQMSYGGMPGNGYPPPVNTGRAWGGSNDTRSYGAPSQRSAWDLLNDTTVQETPIRPNTNWRADNVSIQEDQRPSIDVRKLGLTPISITNTNEPETIQPKIAVFEETKMTSTRTAIPVSMCYDPNLFETAEHGLKEIKLDRTRHLRKPKHTPEWVLSPTIAEAETRTAEMQKADAAVVIEEIAEEYSSCSNLDELWAPILLKARLNQEKQNIALYCAGALETLALPITDRSKKFITDLRNEMDLVKAGDLVKDVLANWRGIDLAFAAEINRRLTQEVNIYVTCGMGIDLSMSDFSHDIAELVTVITNTYGKEIADVLLNVSAKIISVSTQCINKSGAEQIDYINTLNDDAFSEADAENVAILDSSSYLFAINLSSVELRLEFENARIGNAVFESSPFAFKIVNMCMKHEKASLANHVYLSTTDGVKFIITAGAFNPNTYQIKLV